jgi:transcriptional regulator with XRE-family HTH domain
MARGERTAVELRRQIIKRRKLLELSQAELAKRLGMHYTTVSKIEAGTRAVSVDELIGLAELFGTTTDALLGVHNDAVERTRNDLAWSAGALRTFARDAARQLVELAARLDAHTADLRHCSALDGSDAADYLLEVATKALPLLDTPREALQAIADAPPAPELVATLAKLGIEIGERP